MSAVSLQAPDDWHATFREKRGEGHQGYVANVAESCHPDNDLQLIVDLHAAPNNTDDAAMLAEQLPGLKQRTGVNTMHTDAPTSLTRSYRNIRWNWCKAPSVAGSPTQPNSTSLTTARSWTRTASRWP